MSSFQVCLGLKERGPLIICASRREGDYGPIVGYVFTENHLLVKTIGAKPSPDFPGSYASDPGRQYYFIVDKHIDNPYAYEPIGPLERDVFFAHAAVPGDLQWETPTNPNGLIAFVGVLLLLGVALLIYGWPLILVIVGVILFLAVRRIFRTFKSRKEKKLHNA